jgi:hypothetical protein
MSTRWCSTGWLRWLNDVLHTSHLNGLYWVCTCRCILRWLWWSKDLLHASQPYGRSPLCRRWWCLRLQWWQNVSHLYGLFPLCVRWSVFSILCALNTLVSTLRPTGCSTLCMRSWAFRWLWTLKALLHTSQENGLCRLCMHRCVFRWLSVQKDLLHESQPNGSSPQWSSWFLLRLQCSQNALSHLCGFSQVCICWVLVKWTWSSNNVSHTLQPSGCFSPIIVCGSCTITCKMRRNNMKKIFYEEKYVWKNKYTRRLWVKWRGEDVVRVRAH